MYTTAPFYYNSRLKLGQKFFNKLKHKRNKVIRPLELIHTAEIIPYLALFKVYTSKNKCEKKSKLKNGIKMFKIVSIHFKRYSKNNVI